MKEIEIKIINIEVNDIKSKLLRINAAKVKNEYQENKIFDFPQRKLLNSKGYARIRIVNDIMRNTTRYYMTVKKMISQEKYKIMDEHETEIRDPKEGENIFRALGLELVQSIKKTRESYRYKDALIEIDINDKSFCPFPYIEVETSNEETLKEVVKLLGYTMKDTTSKTIYEILDKKGALKGL